MALAAAGAGLDKKAIDVENHRCHRQGRLRGFSSCLMTGQSESTRGQHRRTASMAALSKLGWQAISVEGLPRGAMGF